MTGKIPPFAALLFNNVRHQAQIVFHKDIPGFQVPLGAPLQAGFLLRCLQRTGKGPASSRQTQGKKQSIHHQINDGRQHVKHLHPTLFPSGTSLSLISCRSRVKIHKFPFLHSPRNPA